MTRKFGKHWVRVSASQSVDPGFITLVESYRYQNTLKNGIVGNMFLRAITC